MTAPVPPVFEDEGTPGAQNAPRTGLDHMFGEFEDRYRRETTEVRSLSVQMHDNISLAEGVLNKLADRPPLQRVWHWLTCHTSSINISHCRHQLKIQQTNLLLTAAIARQNRMIVEGLRLTLEKLQHIEDDTRSLRHTVVRMEERRERLRLRRDRASSAWQRAWSWLRSLFGSSCT